MKKINKKLVLAIHHQLITEFGGTQGIRDENLLESALESPYQSFFQNDLYNSIEEKAARLGYGIICNHPFLDGNKRTGIHCTLLLLLINEIKLEYTQKELWQIALHIAHEGTYEELLQWIDSHKISK